MVSGFFELLSIMPALKALAFGTLDYPVNLDREADTFDSYSASLLAPACSLTHLIVLDDSDVNFKHYPQLLSRSHHTLEHIELHRIYDLGVADGLRATLQHCTRLRHLALEANSFANERIISACPRLQSLSLSSAPTASEMAALQAPLRALELTNYYSNTVTPEQFVAHTAWKRLRVILGYATSLSTIRFDLMGQQLQHETEEYSIANCALYARRGVSTSLPCLQDA